MEWDSLSQSHLALGIETVMQEDRKMNIFLTCDLGNGHPYFTVSLLLLFITDCALLADPDPGPIYFVSFFSFCSFPASASTLLSIF